MIPLKIVLTNFLSYEQETFDFKDITCATVVGKNGAGKSSFCTDAITWALYGAGSKGGSKELDKYVKKGADSCTVEYSFLLNGNIYKVIRTRSALKNKHAVNFFVVNADGNEIPLSTGKIGDVQSYIEATLKMNYKTFIAASMILQNKSNEFTEGMTDNERKETLINIINVDEWDNISKKVVEDISKYKNDVILAENMIQHNQNIINRENEYVENKNNIAKELEQIKLSKEKEEQELNNYQEKIFKIDSLENEINNAQNTINNLDQSISQKTTQINLLNRQINDSVEKENNYKNQVIKSKNLIAEKEQIENAVVEEQKLTFQLKELESKKMIFLEEQNNINVIVQKGKDWNSQHNNQINNINFQIENYKKQADALNNVPCTNNIDFKNSCPFLKMANEAKNKIIELQNQLTFLNGEINPHKKNWFVAKQKLDEFKAQFSENELLMIKNRIAEIKFISEKKQQLDLAISRVDDYQNMINSLIQDINNKKEIIVNMENSILNEKNEKEKQNNDLNAKKYALKNFEEVKNKIILIKDTLSRLSNQEQDKLQEKAKTEMLLSQIESSKIEVEKIKKDILEKQQLLKTATILQDACSKKAGVPALIIENAVPELETLANDVLNKMMDGRLQLKLETQIEGKTKGVIQEVLRITVLDESEARDYSTYSGAEKFIVDMAIRIALSKFLAHRAGASVKHFVLDEGVSCADDENRHEIITAIRNISGEFEKILFITHIDELKDSLEEKILVTKDSRGSHIKIIN